MMSYRHEYWPAGADAQHICVNMPVGLPLGPISHGKLCTCHSSTYWLRPEVPLADSYNNIQSSPASERTCGDAYQQHHAACTVVPYPGGLRATCTCKPKASAAGDYYINYPSKSPSQVASTQNIQPPSYNSTMMYPTYDASAVIKNTVCSSDISFPDVLSWQQKHVDQLKQQRQLIADKLGVISRTEACTASGPKLVTLNEPVESSNFTIPLNCNLQNEEVNTSLCLKSFPPLHTVPATTSDEERIKKLEGELRKQELTVKLYKSMLRKSRQELETLRAKMTAEVAEYKEKISCMEAELERNKQSTGMEMENNVCREISRNCGDKDDCIHAGDADLASQSIPEIYLNRSVADDDDDSESRRGAIADSLFSGMSSACDDFNNYYYTSSLADMTTSSMRSFGEVTTESTLSLADDLSRLSYYDDAMNGQEPDEVIGSLRGELARRSENLKVLRRTLKQLSRSHHTMLEKNFALKDQLEKIRKRIRGPTDSIDARLMAGLTRCTQDLGVLVNACSVVSSKQDSSVERFMPVPSLSDKDDRPVGGGKMNSFDVIVQLHHDIDRLKRCISNLLSSQGNKSVSGSS